MLVMVDKASGCVTAIPLPGKSVNSSWLPAYVVRNIQHYGHHGGVILKSDREHAVTDLLHQVARLRQPRTQIEKSALGDSQSNGLAERAVQTAQMMTRTLLLDVEARTQASLPLDSPAGSWLIRHAVDLHNKRQLGVDRKTPYHKARGRQYVGELFRWGTNVLYRLSGEVHGGVMAARWRSGIWLGKTWT